MQQYATTLLTVGKNISDLKNQLLCPIQYEHIDEVPKFLADSPSETTYVTQVSNPLVTAQLLIIHFQLKGLPVILLCIYHILLSMRIKTSPRFNSQQNSHLGTHQ